MKPGEWKGTCLIVDDEADIREIMAMHASWLGFNFLEAADGEQALAALRSQPVDIVISDLMMPRMPGMRLLEAMRKEGYNMPFIFLTAFASKDVTIQALRLGAFDFLEKPFEATAVRNTLAEAMRLSQDQKRLENKVSSSSDTGEIVPEK